MDREILFRGKRESDGKWLYGLYSDDYVHDTDFPCIMPLRTEKDDGDWAVLRETVGQYTGLTDKNGKKIFEGDIIKIPDNYDEFGINAGEVYEVYFAFGGFRLKPKYSKAKGFWLEDDATVEIIGTIHDNSDLLEVSE